MLVYTSSMEQTKARLHADFQIKVTENGNWDTRDLEFLHTSIKLFAEAMGGNENSVVAQNTWL